MADTQINRPLAYALTYAYAIIGYLVINHNIWRTPHFLPLTPFDIRTPMMEWTAWIYITVYIVPLAPLVLVQKEHDVRAMLFCFNILSTLCFTVFLAYPTIYPRPALEGIAFPLNVIHGLDRAVNCCPSLHVIYAFLSAFFVRHYKPRFGNFLLIWAVVISISTLTTKQHYMWDVVVGYVLARITYKAAEAYFNRTVIPPKAVQ